MGIKSIKSSLAYGQAKEPISQSLSLLFRQLYAGSACSVAVQLIGRI